MSGSRSPYGRTAGSGRRLRPSPSGRGPRSRTRLSTPEASGADVAETDYICVAHTRQPIPARLVVRRVHPTPGSQLALFTSSDYHAFVTDRAVRWSRSRPT